ncbi:MAG: hypothetical protein Q8P46_07505 [Hyphomicrobiales bacterium]|nr:hypothetical protein [Hyphomicrobiales bacterium]
MFPMFQDWRDKTTVLLVAVSAGLVVTLNAHLAVALAGKAADAGAAAASSPGGLALLLGTCMVLGRVLRGKRRI